MKKLALPLLLVSISIVSCKKVETPEPEVTKEVIDTTEIAIEEPVSIPDSATINKAWMDYMTPSDMHTNLAKDNGIWDEELTMWMSADAQPETTKATAQYRMILNGLHQEMIHKGDFMGMPFEGRGTMSFDNASQEYISTWIDNMSSGITTMRGKLDKESNVLKMEGQSIDPVTKKMKVMREVITYIDNDTHRLEMYDTGYDNVEYKTMEILLKRRK
ncbi:hypothetical protein SY27_02085 [Flavobacterium sp. 316]|uniref:DUF1579 domain-containing protein n=1 Tax=Flavobacterium sp. 316 TaxID=1603293 RepID=UPI0005E537E1|nr:DUF1579 domain-containing protein [Flavobacterium sp. 316]KIX22638.1 hypothetical protein SY27_02085 [Flavobacterium sp. 316]